MATEMGVEVSGQTVIASYTATNDHGETGTLYVMTTVAGENVQLDQYDNVEPGDSVTGEVRATVALGKDQDMADVEVCVNDSFLDPPEV